MRYVWRIAFRALSFLTVGAVLAILVAQFVAWNSNPSLSSAPCLPAPDAPDWVLYRMGPIDPNESSLYQSAAVEAAAWGEFPVPGRSQRHIYRVRAGWPWLAMESRSVVDRQSSVPPINWVRAALKNGGFSLNLPEAVPKWMPRNILVRPLWGGLALNSVLFAAGTYLVMMVARKLTSAARKRKSHRVCACERCGYSLVGLYENRCPECGTQPGSQRQARAYRSQVEAPPEPHL